MDVRSFKLIDGIELVAELLSVHDQVYTLRRPLVITPMRGNDGIPRLAFSMWSMIRDYDKEVRLFHHSMMDHPAEVTEDISSSYIQQVTGLLVPAAPSGQILQG